MGRRTKGDGALFWSESRQRYIGRAIVGRRTDGRPVYVERSGATKSDVRRKLHEAGAKLAGDAPTVGEWCTRWLASLTVRPLTKDGYTTSTEKRIRPALGSMQLAAVTPFDVELAAQTWGKTVGANTVRLTLAHLRIAFGAAERARLVTSNPVAAARKPRAERKPVTPFTAEELRRIIAAGCAEPKWLPLAFLAATGCRRGECLALDAPALDLAAGTVHISRGDQGRHGIGAPKSRHSVRTLALRHELIAPLRAAVDKRLTGCVFRTSTGGRLNDSGIAERHKALLKHLNIPYRNLHKLRHGVGTALSAAGMSLANLAKWLGDKPATVAKVYVHETAAAPDPYLKIVFG